MKVFRDASALERRRDKEENRRGREEEEQQEEAKNKSSRAQGGDSLSRGEKKEKEEEEGGIEGGLSGDVYDELYQNDETLADFHSTTQFHPAAFKVNAQIIVIIFFFFFKNIDTFLSKKSLCSCLSVSLSRDGRTYRRTNTRLCSC